MEVTIFDITDQLYINTHEEKMVTTYLTYDMVIGNKIDLWVFKNLMRLLEIIHMSLTE